MKTRKKALMVENPEMSKAVIAIARFVTAASMVAATSLLAANSASSSQAALELEIEPIDGRSSYEVDSIVGLKVNPPSGSNGFTEEGLKVDITSLSCVLVQNELLSENKEALILVRTLKAGVCVVNVTAEVTNPNPAGTTSNPAGSITSNILIDIRASSSTKPLQILLIDWLSIGVLLSSFLLPTVTALAPLIVIAIVIIIFSGRVPKSDRDNRLSSRFDDLEDALRKANINIESINHPASGVRPPKIFSVHPDEIEAGSDRQATIHGAYLDRCHKVTLSSVNGGKEGAIPIKGCEHEAIEILSALRNDR